MKRLMTTILTVVALCMGAVQSFAAMAAADVTAVTTGISDSLALFYTIGGSILIVCAAVWGFFKVKSLLGGK